MAPHVPGLVKGFPPFTVLMLLLLVTYGGVGVPGFMLCLPTRTFKPGRHLGKSYHSSTYCLTILYFLMKYVWLLRALNVVMACCTGFARGRHDSSGKKHYKFVMFRGEHPEIATILFFRLVFGAK